MKEAIEKLAQDNKNNLSRLRYFIILFNPSNEGFFLSCLRGSKQRNLIIERTDAFLSYLRGSKRIEKNNYETQVFLSYLRGSKLFSVTHYRSSSFLSYLRGSKQ